MGRYYARSASNKTDDWPFWYVADGDRGALNVTAELCERLEVPGRKPGAVLMGAEQAVELAMLANAKGPH